MKLRIFIASPSDVAEERDIVSFVVSELRRTVGNALKVELETVRWETHSWPDIGDDAQDVINQQIGEYDIFVGIMWKRFGTPTKRVSSGTGEEFERAYNFYTRYQRPKIMFYFRRSPFYTTETKEWSQFQKVIQFRKKLEKLGAFFGVYDDPLSFECDVREHLTKQIFKITQTKEPKPKPPKKAPKLFLSSAREDSSRIRSIYKALKAQGFEPWMDVEDLFPGQSWMSEIERAINQADFFLLFLSEASISKRGFVQKEINYALERVFQLPEETTYIIPVRLDAVQPTERLLKYQWVDLFSPDGLNKLIFAIRAAWNVKKTNQ